MVIPDLPMVLVEEILSKVPSVSLKRLRSTCKQWNDLLEDQRFSEKHSREAAKQPLLLMLKNWRVYLMSVNLNVTRSSIEFKSALSLKVLDSNPKQVDIIIASHCDGLLLCTTERGKLVVWNPLLRETWWIPFDFKHKGYVWFDLGYQNSRSCRSYKIIGHKTQYSNGEKVVEFKIYEFDSNKWRKLDDVVPGSLKNYGVCLNGDIYWLASDQTDRLLKFDFTREKFTRFCTPPFQRIVFANLSVTREERFVVTDQNIDTSKMEIWLTNKTNTKQVLSWSKYFEADLRIPDRSWVCRSLLIDEEKKVVFCCTTNVDTVGENLVYIMGEEDEYNTEITYIESRNQARWVDRNQAWLVDSVGSERRPWIPCILNYVPSLIRPARCVQEKRI